MGQKYTHDCPRCGFSALVSGKGDAGMEMTTVTIECLTCQILIDVPDAHLEEDEGFVEQRVECPVHPDHP